jgi:hypothetical protein
MKRVVIWGLRKTRHSHRFIHQGFYENFKKLGYETEWFEDESCHEINNVDFVFASGMAIKHLIITKNTSYIFHNVDLTEAQVDYIAQNRINFINVQVFTNDSKGIVLDNPNAIYDEHSKTLYQPWGTPLNWDEWWPYQPKNLTNNEYWVGSIWNNNLNQGNKAIMEEYKSTLSSRGTRLIRRGGSRFRLNGISDDKSAQLIRKSKYAATIVGSWQQLTHYIPCRLFKNLSYGMPILSNMEKPNFLSSNCGFNQNLNALLDFAENEHEQSRKERFLVSRNEMLKFTYVQNIERILKVLKNV